MSRKIHTKDELIALLKMYYVEFNKVPTTRDLKSNKDYPHPETYRKVFGSHKEALIVSGLYDLKEDKSLFDRKEYTKDDIIRLTRNFISENKRLPIVTDFKSHNNLPSVAVMYKHFNTLNELIIYLGFDPLYDSLVIKSDDELISDLRKLYVQLGKTPSSKEIEKSSITASFNAYANRFGSIYMSFEKAGIPFKKRNKFLSNHEVIDVWYKLKYELNRVPTIEEMRESEINVSDCIKMRWGTYSEFLRQLGEDANYNAYGCTTHLTTNNTKCFSVMELKLTQWLEDNDIEFHKDFPYKNILKDDGTNRTLDWLIKNNNHTYYVELFGILNSESYDAKTKSKKDDFKDNELNLIGIYPNDMRKKSPSEILSFIL